MFGRCLFPLNVLDLQCVESVDVEPMDVKGRWDFLLKGRCFQDRQHLRQAVVLGSLLQGGALRAAEGTGTRALEGASCVGSAPSSLCQLLQRPFVFMRSFLG